MDCGATPWKISPQYWTGGNNLWVTPKDVRGAIVNDTEDKLTDLGAKILRVFQEGSLVVVGRSGILRHTLPVAIVSKAFTVNQDLKVLVPYEPDGATAQFVRVTLANREQELLSRLVKAGTTVESVDWKAFGDTTIAWPTRLERVRICEILETADAAIRETEGIVSKLKQLKAGLLHDLLTRGLDEQGRLRNPISQPDQFQQSDIGLVPKSWTVPRFASVLTGIDVGHSPNCPNITAGPGEWGVLKVSAVTNEGFAPSENKRIDDVSEIDESCEVTVGDLLMTRCNTPELVGAATLVDDTPSRLMLCDKTFRLRVDPNRDEPRFLVHVLRMPSVRRQIELNATGTSGSMKNISQDNIRLLVIPRPPVDEQRLIAKRIDLLLHCIVAEQFTICKLRSVRSGLGNDLLSGRIRVKVCESQCQ